MPHCIVEYSAPLAAQIDIQALATKVHLGTFDSGLFELNAIKTRAYCAQHYLVGDHDDAQFVHIQIAIMPGRTVAQKQVLLDSVSKALSDYSTIDSLTIEVVDLAKEAYFKKLG